MVHSTVIDRMDFKKITQQLIVQRYSANTISTYVSCLERFKQYLDTSNSCTIDDASIQSYLFMLVSKNYSISAQNQHINAIKFYLEKVLKEKRKTYYIDRPRRNKKLPTVLSEQEVQLILSQISNLKHKTIISLIYSCGLRIGEVIQLKITDIDSTRMLIHIRNSKGAKDRMIPLADNLLVLLRNYYKTNQSRIYSMGR